MVSFLTYDIAFLVIFTLWVIWFLYTRKHNLKREGIIYLYRTRLGIKFIEYIGSRFKRTLKYSQYFSIALGYVLMIGILYVLIFTAYTYIAYPEVTDVIKAPPVLPLLPYFPELFGLSSFFPPLYFTYWIVALLVVACVHEFAHGIFANYHGLKIKSTGFAFLGPILGAFVEPDEKEMVKKSNTAQLSILSAGVFANILTTLVFLVLLWAIFSVTFVPAGVIIGGYASGMINIDDITKVNGITFNGDFTGFLDENNTKIQTMENNYTIPTILLKEQLAIIDGENTLSVYLDAPAINNNMYGAISNINGNKISNIDDLNFALSNLSPGDEISVETINGEGTKSYNVTLISNPLDKTKPFLGVQVNNDNGKTFGSFMANILFFKDSNVYYEQTNQFLAFMYYLVWWIVIINFFVALFNMLPVSILDGGRFFYITLMSITKSEKATKIIYKTMAYGILGIFIILMGAWIFAL